MVPLLVLLPDSLFLCWRHSAMGTSACWKRWRKCSICPCHLGVSYITSCMCPAEHTMCCQCNTPYRPCWTSSLNSQCACTLCVIHSDNSHVHATALCSVCVFALAHPTMSCIPLVTPLFMQLTTSCKSHGNHKYQEGHSTKSPQKLAIPC